MNRVALSQHILGKLLFHLRQYSVIDPRPELRIVLINLTPNDRSLSYFYGWIGHDHLKGYDDAVFHHADQIGDTTRAELCRVFIPLIRFEKGCHIAGKFQRILPDFLPILPNTHSKAITQRCLDVIRGEIRLHLILTLSLLPDKNFERHRVFVVRY